METLIMVDRDGNEVEVEPGNVDAALGQGFEAAAEFDTPEGQPVVVKRSDFQTAFERGLKPKNYKEMSFWEATKAGAKRGWDVFASQETGFEPEKTSLEQEQAYAEHPVGYGLGMAAGMAPVIGGGAAAVGGAAYGAKKGMQKLAPMVQPSAVAAKQAYGQAMQNEMIPDIGTGKGGGVVKPIVGAASAIGAAVGQIPETRREIANLQKLEQTQRNRQAGAVGPQAQRPMLGVELMEEGATPEKAAIAERAASIAPGQILAKPLTDVMAMGTTRRSTARGFRPELAAEEIAPGLKASLGYLRKGKGEAYGKLHEEAGQQYDPITGVFMPTRVGEIEKEARKTKGITGKTREALSTVKQILDKGPAPYRLTPGEWTEADPQEQYRRIKAAREFLGEHITQVTGTKDPSILNAPSLRMLKQAHGELDSIMKAIPSQQKADELYNQSMIAKKAFYDAMEFGKGEKKRIDVPTVKKLFGNNDKAYRIREGIETMRAFLQKYGDAIVPEKRAEMEKVVNRFDELRKQAEDKRLIEGVRQMQGPTSPALERTAGLRQKAGLPSDIYTSPAGSLTAADEFMQVRVPQLFGQGAKFEKLAPEQKNAMVRLLMWRQQNPQATMTEEEAMFKKMMKGK